MDQENQPMTQDIHRVTYRLLQHLAQQMKPVTTLAQEVTSPNEPHPLDIIIELLQQVAGGIEQIHTRLEKLESRLDDPAVVKAVRQAVHG
jgi:hypothetical protein